MPRKIAVLLDRLPERIKHCKYIRVHYNKSYYGVWPLFGPNIRKWPLCQKWPFSINGCDLQHFTDSEVRQLVKSGYLTTE